MSQTEELRQMFATMLRVPPGDLGPETSLAALNTSLGGARIRLGLKRLGLALPAGSNPATFGALLAALSGEAPAEAGPVAAKPAPPAYSGAAAATATHVAGSNGLAGLQVGLDVEEVRSMPPAADYWEHEFYRGSFSSSEISYAVLQTDPRTHFAGCWCAKEALRKCDPAFAAVSPAATAVAHDSNGRPYLTLDTQADWVRLPHALSISHTGELATAIVVAIPAKPEAAVNSAEPASLALPSPAVPTATV